MSSTLHPLSAKGMNELNYPLQNGILSPAGPLPLGLCCFQGEGLEALSFPLYEGRTQEGEV